MGENSSIKNRIPFLDFPASGEYNGMENGGVT